MKIRMLCNKMFYDHDTGWYYRVKLGDKVEVTGIHIKKAYSTILYEAHYKSYKAFLNEKNFIILDIPDKYLKITVSENDES